MMKTHHYSKSLIFPILLVLYEIATYLSNDMYLPALPQMMKDIGLSIQQAQTTLTTWFIGSAFLPLIMGVIADRYGRRPVLLMGGVIYILATLVCAVTRDANILLIARFIEGAAIPSMMVAGYACIHELYDQKEAIKILALMGSITVLAPALGPLLGSIILYFTSWRGIFWFIALWALITIVLLHQWMPETFPPEKRQPIHFGTLCKQYTRVLSNKKFMLLMMVIGFIFTGFIIWITAGPLLVIENFHYTPVMFGMFQACVFAAYIGGNHLVKYLLESMGVNTLVRTGLLMTLAGGLLVLVSSLCFANTIYPFLLSMTLYSFGSALCFSPLNRSVIDASDEAMSVRVSLFTVLWTGFAVLGSASASIFYSGTLSSIAYPIAASIIISCIMKVIASYKA